MKVFGYRVAGLILLVLIGTASSSAAQQMAAISGVVSDQTGAAVTGARVELVSGLAGSRAAVTDGAGRCNPCRATLLRSRSPELRR